LKKVLISDKSYIFVQRGHGWFIRISKGEK